MSSTSPAPLITPALATIKSSLTSMYNGARSGLLTINFKRGSGPMGTQFFRVAEPSELVRAADFAHQSALQNDVYFGVGLRREDLDKGRGNADSVIAIPALWVDVDIAGPAHAEQNLPPDKSAALSIVDAVGLKPTIVVNSGHGLHAYWVLEEIWELDDAGRKAAGQQSDALQQIMQSAAQSKGWKIDNTTDLARVLRIPGTINRKKDRETKEDLPPVLVTMERTGPRYTLKQIDAAIRAATPRAGFVGFDGFAGGAPSGKSQSAGGSVGFEGYFGGAPSGNTPAAEQALQPAELGPILQGCGWMRFCEDKAAELPEPDCYAMLSVVGRCKNGEQLAQRLSAPYPGYTSEETRKKLEHAVTAAGPTTCEFVMNKLGRTDICGQCPNLGKVLSPINLGTPKAVTSATPNAVWGKPEPLSAALPKVSPFDPDMLPVVLRKHVMDVSERLQVPPDFPAATLVVGLAGAIGRRAIITPMEYDSTWQVVPNLWGALVARPGLMKSPVIRTMLAPLHRLQEEAMTDFKVAMEAYEKELEVWEARKAAWKKKAAKGGGEQFDNPKPEKPGCTRFLANDATIEKLHEIISENQQGVLVVRDELVGWMATLDTKGRERERPFFLEGWNGDGSYTVDRIGRGTVHVEHLCISLFGGIQPSKLQSYFADAVTGGATDDGLAQRIQVLVWPDQSKEWHQIDRPADLEAADAVDAVFRRITGMMIIEPLRLHFDPEAQQLFNTWREILENRLRQEKMPAALEAHLAKYRKLMPALALIFHVAERVDTPDVPLIQAQRAAAWCDYLESHAQRVYSSVKSFQNRLAFELGEKLKEGALGTTFTVRDAYIKGWANLDTRENVRLALGVLEDAGWVRAADPGERPKGGRPTERYLVNPAVYRG